MSGIMDDAGNINASWTMAPERDGGALLRLLKGEGGANERPLTPEELDVLPFSILVAHARATGLSMARIDAMSDEAHSRAGLVKLILETRGQNLGFPQRPSLHDQLHQMKVSTLIQRARAAGVPTVDIDAAHDEPDPRDALVQLIQGSYGIQWGELGAPKEEAAEARRHEYS